MEAAPSLCQSDPVATTQIQHTSDGSPRCSNASDDTIDNFAARHPRIRVLEEEWLNNNEPITIFPDQTTFLASVKRQCLQRKSAAASKVLESYSDTEIARLDERNKDRSSFIHGYSDEITILSDDPTLLNSIKRQCLEQRSTAASKALRSYTEFMATTIGDPTAQEHYEEASQLYDIVISLQEALVALLSQPRDASDKAYYDVGDGAGGAGDGGDGMSNGVGASVDDDDDDDVDDVDGSMDSDDDVEVIDPVVDNLVDNGLHAFDIVEIQRDKLAEMALSRIRAAEAMQHLEGHGDAAERPFKRRRVDDEAS